MPKINGEEKSQFVFNGCSRLLADPREFPWKIDRGLVWKFSTATGDQNPRPHENRRKASDGITVHAMRHVVETLLLVASSYIPPNEEVSSRCFGSWMSYSPRWSLYSGSATFSPFPKLNYLGPVHSLYRFISISAARRVFFCIVSSYIVRWYRGRFANFSDLCSAPISWSMIIK